MYCGKEYIAPSQLTGRLEVNEIDHSIWYIIYRDTHANRVYLEFLNHGV